MVYAEAAVGPIAFRYLSQIRGPGPKTAELPIRVIDISKYVQANGENPVSKIVIKKIIDSLGALKPPPTVIAFDIDFSSRNHPTQIDPSILTFESEHGEVLKLISTDTKGVSYLLGVGSTEHNPLAAFYPKPTTGATKLLAKQLASSAASIRAIHNPAKLPLFYQAPNSSQVMPTMGYAIASKLAPNFSFVRTPSGILQDALGEPESNDKELQFAMHLTLIDYRILSQWKDLVYKVDDLDTNEAHTNVFSQETFESLQKSVSRIKWRLDGESSDRSTYAVVVGRADPEILSDSVPVSIPEGTSGIANAVEEEVFPRLSQHVALASTLLGHRLEVFGAAVEKGLECTLITLSVIISTFAHHAMPKSEKEKLSIWGALYGLFLGFGSIVLSIPLAFGLTLVPHLFGPTQHFIPDSLVYCLVGVTFLGIFISQFHKAQKSPHFLEENEAFFQILQRFSIIGITLWLTIFLAQNGVFWIGFVVVVLFSLVEGYIEPLMMKLLPSENHSVQPSQPADTLNEH